MRFLLKSAFLIALILIAIHTGLFVWTTNQLKATKAALSAAGEPVVAADLNPPPIPPERNGCVDVGKACTIVHAPTPAKDRIDGLQEAIGYPLLKFERQRLTAYLAERVGCEHWLAEAAKKSAFVALTPITEPAVYLPDLAPVRDVANYVAFRAIVQHQNGEDDQALSTLAWIEPVARTAAASPGIVGRLIAAGCRGLQSDTLWQIAPDLRVGTAPGEATPQQLRRCIAMLLDARQIHQEERAALRAERVTAFNSFDFYSGQASLNPQERPPLSRRVAGYLVRPYWNWNQIVAARYFDVAIQGTTEADCVSAHRFFAARVPPLLSPWWLKINVSILMPSLDRASEVTYLLDTSRALAATALAVRWFESEQHHLPSSLDELVPDYLPQVPWDVMAPNTRLHARFDGKDPILWSVGPDGVDNGGDDHVAKEQDNAWQGPDLVVHLTPQPRVLDDLTRQRLKLDLDSPIPSHPDQAGPAPATAPSARGEPEQYPNWELLDAFTVDGDVAAFSDLKTRRDVLAALASAAVQAPGPPDAATHSTTQPVGRLAGVADVDHTPWNFELFADGTGTLRSADGRITHALHWSTERAAKTRLRICQ